jgi:hypothetical protein
MNERFDKTAPVFIAVRPNQHRWKNGLAAFIQRTLLDAAAWNSIFYPIFYLPNFKTPGSVEGVRTNGSENT